MSTRRLSICDTLTRLLLDRLPFGITIILYEIGRNDPARLPEEDVVVFVDNLGASSVDLGIRIWVKTADYWDTKWRLMENIKYALDENHISIPYQQIDVQIKQ